MVLLSLTAALAADLTVGPAGTYPTLEAALVDAVDGDRLLVEPGGYVEPRLDIGARTLTIEATATGVSLRSTSNRRAFYVAGGDLTLIGFQIDLQDNIGLVELRTGRFEVRDTEVTAARAPINGQPGGSIDAEDGTVLVADCLFDGAVAPIKNGGHVYGLRTDVTIERSTLQGGSANSGGAVYVDGGSLTVTDSTFADDVGDSTAVTAVLSPVVWTTSTLSGSTNGGIAVSGADLDISDSTFSANLGGAITVVDGNGTVSDSSLEGNSGGAITLTNGTLTLTDTTVTGNDGGGLSITAGTLLVTGGSLDTNSAEDGAALLADTSDVTLDNVRLEDNVATVGDVLRCTGGTLCTLTTPHIEGNVATNAVVAFQGAPGMVTGATACLQAGSTTLFDVDLGGSLSMTGSAILANQLPGPALQVSADSSAELVNNSLVLQQAGESLVLANGPLTLTNNLIAHTTSAGVAVRAQGGLAGGYNLYFDNSGGDVEPAPLGTDVVGVDPGIGSPMVGDCDVDTLKPRYGSALIDAGDPTILDLDGSPSDIGAFGGDSPNPDPGTENDDLDGDGFGIPSDCDDTNADISPAAPEVGCNGVDDDCNPDTIDNIDADGDGVGVCDDDCDDTDPTVTEIVDVYLDNDRDGFGIGDPTPFCVPPTNSAPVDGDCDDTDPASYPGAEDVPYDGIDQDCDGEDLDDLDGDGVLGEFDCNDEDAGISPRLDEIPDDGIDQDCTGSDQVTTVNGAVGWRCGCAASGPAAGGWLLPLVLVIGSRRRRS